MKKILIILFITLACSSSFGEISWQDMEKEFDILSKAMNHSPILAKCLQDIEIQTELNKSLKRINISMESMTILDMIIEFMIKEDPQKIDKFVYFSHDIEDVVCFFSGSLTNSRLSLLKSLDQDTIIKLDKSSTINDFLHPDEDISKPTKEYHEVIAFFSQAILEGHKKGMINFDEQCEAWEKIQNLDYDLFPHLSLFYRALMQKFAPEDYENHFNRKLEACINEEL